jgi:hypothetical protein
MSTRTLSIRTFSDIQQLNLYTPQVGEPVEFRTKPAMSNKKTTDRLTDHQICESDIYNWFDKRYSRNGLLD